MTVHAVVDTRVTLGHAHPLRMYWLEQTKSNSSTQEEPIRAE